MVLGPRAVAVVVRPLTVHAYAQDLEDRGALPAAVNKTLRALGRALEERGLSNPLKIGRPAPATPQAGSVIPRRGKFRSPSSGSRARSDGPALVSSGSAPPATSIDLL